MDNRWHGKGYQAAVGACLQATRLSGPRIRLQASSHSDVVAAPLSTMERDAVFLHPPARQPLIRQRQDCSVIVVAALPPPLVEAVNP